MIIDHPAWGRVTNAEAAANDIYYHSCKMYRDALARMKARQDFAKMIREDERASLHRMQEPGV